MAYRRGPSHACSTQRARLQTEIRTRSFMGHPVFDVLAIIGGASGKLGALPPRRRQTRRTTGTWDR
jgi:hypothetical protein